ncbi:hypothetical protein H2201_008493 [Coniosporium apollinis]|uniref:Peptidase A1 domain-containing protein n=1 Tax=Coniosporium apollinis TaxID=61459 RepID=A0ABQ9NGU6_9PEZI|nr:hypothetical protein H2201_008493 [Coniosporium apollinis]
MPYGSFDLNASAPLFDTSTRYFPLKRAVNDSQYTLGRTFLQQAYVIVDYERSNFSVSQALFPDTSIPLHIVPILPPGEGSSSAGLSTAAIAGIVVGAVVIVVVAILAAFIIRRKQRGATAALAKEGEKVRCEKAELDAGATARHETEVHPLVQLDHGQIANSKISGSGPVGELSGGSAEPSELEGHMKNPGKVYDSASPYEAVGPGGEPRGEAYELPAADVLLPELESRLPAVPVEALRGL